MNTPKLPPLPAHPEPRVMTWSELEKQAIKEYGEACALAATEPLLQRIAELERQLHEQAVSLEEARKDAKRYQSILSACESDGFGYWLPEICLKIGSVPPSKDECDFTIDAVMQRGQS